ncbi:uveal autoantigen with coiled-coil domains and ankyrin repeats protein-like isoform X2 [Scleropages formosus]|uniref:Uveal autoantigen with coiled-coil domains and ankyrin repeats n=1 Tax=Scleropages formosus TaxID=113540 RepID=A0A8C9RDM1_SCLFO|nr:uveal autoantigen with coiled-coil domains and ankyrin repeats isoform X2 [Scleropages formosus]
MSRWLKCTSVYFNTDWNKYDDRLMKAVERGEGEKVAALLGKKGIVPTKLDVEGRSAFHLAATRGHLDCLNLILGHGVDVIAKDAAGKNALHLAARNGHSLCVQKLLQHNCPVGNVDLQGRTALHDAVMAGCASSVKLLCDSGASVNATDFDGRTPLVLATQMCHPHICQLLLERRADITVRDKQNKTALILGCEYVCKDAVEVLLRAGADVMAVDGFGHDSYHYARLSKNVELVALVRNAVESAAKAKGAAKMEQRLRQQSIEMAIEAEANIKDQIIHELERKNESQQESLKKLNMEHRILLDKVNQLHQQLSQEKLNVEDMQKERDQLKLLLISKEKEDGVRTPETVKVQLKSPLGDYSGQSVIKGKDNILVKQSQSLDSASLLQSGPASLRSVSRPLELTVPGMVPAGEAEALRKELEAVRKSREAAEQEAGRLKESLARKIQECEELAQSRDAAKRESERQVRELEEALSDVQKRMLDSEAKVKQLQSHVVAVKERLSSQQLEDLRVQLQDVKSKYEGASTEVGRLRNQLKQSEKALEEYKKSEGALAEETERLTKELENAKKDKEALTLELVDMESLVKELEVGQMSMVPTEKFDNMKNLLTNAVDEKEKQLAEVREDYDRVLEEAAELHRELDSQRTRAERTVSQTEHERVRAALEEQNGTLKKKLTDVTAKSQALIREVEEIEKERELLRVRVQDLNKKMQTQYVPLKSHEELKKSLNHSIEDLNKQLIEAVQKRNKDEEELKKLEVERATLCENVTNLKSQYIQKERLDQEVATLTAHNGELEKELELLKAQCQDKEKELDKVVAEYTSLRQSLQRGFVPRGEHEKMKDELSRALEEAKCQVSSMVKRCKESEDELGKVKERSEALNKKLQGAQTTLEKDYVSFKEHEEVKSKLSRAVSEMENREKEALLKYQSAQEETNKLHKEIEEQKKELDTIQEAIRSRFIPLAVVEERELSFSASLKNLTEQLAEMQEKYNRVKKEGECHKREKEMLEVEMTSVQEKMEKAFVPAEKYQEVERLYRGLGQRLEDLEKQCKDVSVQKTELEERKAQCDAEIQSLRHKLETERVPLEQFEAVKQSLNGSLQQARQECERAAEAHRREADRAGALEKELQARSGDAARLAEQVRIREALEEEVAHLKLVLREAEESNAQRSEDVASLQSELLRATRTLQDLQSRGVEEVASLGAERQKFEEEVVALRERLSVVNEQYEELYREAAQAKESEARARMQTEALQAKSISIEDEIKELKRRYDDSLSTIGDLQKRIQMSSEQTEMKDKKITELLADVERLKQALNGLSQLAYAGNTPKQRQNQHAEALQAQVKSLQQQLADAERQHREVVSIYRTHLLSAAQGHMDEDVQAALLQIIRMRQQFVC